MYSWVLPAAVFINWPSGSGNSSSPCTGPASHPAAGKEENPRLRRLSPPGLTQRSKQAVCHRADLQENQAWSRGVQPLLLCSSPGASLGLLLAVLCFQKCSKHCRCVRYALLSHSLWDFPVDSFVAALPIPLLHMDFPKNLLISDILNFSHSPLWKQAHYLFISVCCSLQDYPFYFTEPPLSCSLLVLYWSYFYLLSNFHFTLHLCCSYAFFKMSHFIP